MKTGVMVWHAPKYVVLLATHTLDTCSLTVQELMLSSNTTATALMASALLSNQIMSNNVNQAVLAGGCFWGEPVWETGARPFVIDSTGGRIYPKGVQFL